MVERAAWAGGLGADAAEIGSADVVLGGGEVAMQGLIFLFLLTAVVLYVA